MGKWHVCAYLCENTKTKIFCLHVIKRPQQREFSINDVILIFICHINIIQHQWLYVIIVI